MTDYIPQSTHPLLPQWVLELFTFLLLNSAAMDTLMHISWYTRVGVSLGYYQQCNLKEREEVNV